VEAGRNFLISRLRLPFHHSFVKARKTVVAKIPVAVATKKNSYTPEGKKGVGELNIL
jgi:hypothetical protein